MAIDRFQNNDLLVSGKVPVERVQVYDLADHANLEKVDLYLNSVENGARMESHIYSADKLVKSLDNTVLNWNNNLNDDEPQKINFLTHPERDIRLGGLESGYYSIVNNFLKSTSPTMKVVNINSDSTELELQTKDTAGIGGLINLYNQMNMHPSQDTRMPNIGLNFANNEISIITDISFANNPRIGYVEQDILHPTSFKGNDATFFSPTNDGNHWIEFYNDKKSNGVPNVGNNNVFTATGRSAKFELDVSTGNAIWVQQLDADGNPIFFTSEVDSNNEPIDESRYYDIPADAQYYNREPISNYLRRGTNSRLDRFTSVRFYNPQIDTSKITNVIVKLYKPLKDGLSPFDCAIDKFLIASYVERVLLYEFDKPEDQPNFSSPNFKIDSGNYGKSQGTDLKSWNDLLDTNLSTSQQIIDKYISGSFGNVNLNLDYTYFGNFVKYSSAVERVNNLKYKLSLVEQFDARINTLESVSGSDASTNISQSISRKDNVVSGMDGWERWMYQESTGSLYTHYSSSNFQLQPWPKQSTYPNVNYSVTSSEAISAYNGLIDSASIFDALNDARLTKVVPAAIVEDPLNKEYVLFVDMIGHHFDITWSYINALTSVNEREEHPYDGMPNELLYDVAKSMGWKLTHGKDTSELWEFGLGTDKFGNVPNSGSLPSKSHEQINNEVWRRIVNNIPYLLKTKGSARAVKALIATYGIPQTFLSIREYGGPVIDTNVRAMWEHDRFVYHLRMDTDNYITVPWDKVSDINNVTYEIDGNPGDGTTITKVVTVDSGKFYIDGVENPTLELLAGNIYKFDVSDSSNSSHPFRFQTASDGSNHPAAVSGTPGQSGAYVKLTVTYSTPNLNYYCTNHANMGNLLTISKGGPNSMDVIEIQIKQDLNRDTGIIRKGKDFAVAYESITPTDLSNNRGNIHFYLSGSGGYKSASINDVNLFDSLMGTLLIERETSVDDITQNNLYKLQYRKNKKDRITISKSASISIDGSTESSYNAAWINSGTAEFGNSFGTIAGAPSIWGDVNPMSGSIQEIRYWANPLKDIVIDEHTLSRESYHGNSMTAAYFDLKFRFLPDSNLKTIANPDSHASQHPNQKLSTTQNGSILSASLFNFENDDLIGVTEEYYTKVPSAGANNIMNNKVRVEDNTLTSVLNTENKVEKSQYDSAPVDSNVVGVYLAATKMYNDDIINHTGYFEIDDLIGDPDNRIGYTEQNEDLDYVRRQVFKKYSNKNLINNTIDILAKYDMSVFEQIRQTMPARVDYNSGILIEPHILERPKVKSLTQVTQTRPMYDAHILTMARPVSASNHLFETEITSSYNFSAEKIGYETTISESLYKVSADNILYEGDSIDLDKMFIITSQKDDVEDVGNPQIRDMYAPSTYKYVIPVYKTGADVGYGLNWNTGSNGSWNYNPLATAIVNSKPSQYAQRRKLFFSTELSASMNLPNSSSLVPSETSTDELPLAVENLRFLGCKMTSDSLTTNSPHTPDGKPVIEIFKADPNVLINTSQTSEEGNLDVISGTGLGTLDIDDLIISDDLYWKRLQEYRRELREFRRKIEKMIDIEDARADEFDLRYKKELLRREAEMFRRKEFDIKNGSPF